MRHPCGRPAVLNRPHAAARCCCWCTSRPIWSPGWYGSPRAPAALCFRVGSEGDLARWDRRLTELGAEHSGPRRAHLGWALDVTDPSGLRIQLHTPEVISADDG